MNGGAHDHIVLSDSAFHAAEGDPTNLKLCQRGEWQERMLVETVLSMLTLVCHFKHVMHRGWAYLGVALLKQRSCIGKTRSYSKLGVNVRGSHSSKMDHSPLYAY